MFLSPYILFTSIVFLKHMSSTSMDRQRLEWKIKEPSWYVY